MGWREKGCSASDGSGCRRQLRALTPVGDGDDEEGWAADEWGE